MKIRSATFFMSRGAERKWQRNRLVLICDACKEQRTALNQKDCPIFIKPYNME